MDGLKPRARSWPLGLMLAMTGCYTWVRVPPSELPRLDQGAPRALLSPDGPPATPVVRDEKGKDVEVAGDFAVKVTTAADSVDFMSPVHCSVKAGTLQLAEDETTPRSFTLGEIRSTEIYRYDRTLSTIVKTLGIVAGGVVLFLLGDAVAQGGP
jgi:hypothetical protein